jgi:Mn2+/Fe2+ NRAMP family transporter
MPIFRLGAKAAFFFAFYWFTARQLSERQAGPAAYVIFGLALFAVAQLAEWALPNRRES